MLEPGIPPTADILPSVQNEISRLSEISQSEIDSKESDRSVDEMKEKASRDPIEYNQRQVVTNIPREKSTSSNSRRETDEISSEKSISGNWGWFEPFEDTKNGDESSSHSKDRKLKNGYRSASGLLEFDKPIFPIVIPINESESSMMAVTAPTYVLEESRSSQRLWKESAGNRPPQPVEERAFYEEMWATNFSNSQVKYSMPMEVLTATTPFFLSPFADGSFEENGSDGVNCTNYNLAPPFNANKSKRIGIGGKNGNDGGAGDIEAVREAEADAAEATLIHGVKRSAGTGKCNNPSLQSMGPHHHHHTLVNEEIKGDGNNDLTILVRGDNVFGTTVSKSFIKRNEKRARGRYETVSVSISIGSYRVVESKKHGKYAQFLVIYCEGNFRETVGVWKRHSDFDRLSRKVSSEGTACHKSCNPFAIDDEHELEHEVLPNAITSWRLLKKRQRWYRCLDAGYLSLKIFLLERFLHDILFESSSSKILRDFVGVDTVK